MNSDLATRAILDLVDRLQAVVTDFGARADKLEKENGLRKTREEQRLRGAAQDLVTEQDRSAAEIDSELQRSRAVLAQRFESRKTRISQAFKNSREQVLARIEKRIDARRYDTQRVTLKAEKERDAAIKAAHHNAQQYRTELAGAEQVLVGHERQSGSAFSGYPEFRKLLAVGSGEPAPPDADEFRLLEEIHKLNIQAERCLRRFQRALLLRFLRYWPVWLLMVAIVAFGLVPIAQQREMEQYGWREAAIAAGVAFGLVLILRFAMTRLLRSGAREWTGALSRARQYYDLCMEKSEARYQAAVAKAHEDYRSAVQEVERLLKEEQASASANRVNMRMLTDQKGARALATNERQHDRRVSELEHQYGDALNRVKNAGAVRREAFDCSAQESLSRLEAEFDNAWKKLEGEWQALAQPLLDQLQHAREKANQLFPDWSQLRTWQAPKAFAGAAPYGRLAVEWSASVSTRSASRLTFGELTREEVPLCLVYPEQGSLLFETGQAGHDEAIATLNQVILRLLTVAPPGRLNFTIVDPVGLGQNFAGVMHLADYEEQLINNKIWTQSSQIEQRLGDLNEHMEKVIQMYLRNEYATIAEYNDQAGVIAEKYHFLVVADFPNGFSDNAIRRLLSIAASGARCGVFVLLHWDTRVPAPQDFLPEELRKACIRVVHREGAFALAGRVQRHQQLLLEAPPEPALATELIHQIGQASRDSSRVEVPFEHVMPALEEIWTEQTTDELTVPIGRTGATKLQYLAIGKGTRQHGLVAGKTGSGKSTLFHVMITNLSLWCSPEAVEFYLVDFKKGVEFKAYANHRLPHARVVAIESDREFGLSVLQKVDEELRRRGDLFRKLGVQDLAGYKRAGGGVLPRSLLLIDEFQEFFVEDDKVAQTASLLLDRIVRQGRAFGIHVILGSQTLGGAYTVARTTLGQMVVRVALQCNEADAYMIMDENNPAPRLLSRPGEGIYNDMAGAIEGNSPFQTVWLPEQVRDRWLHEVRSRADQAGLADTAPFVFEGNAPADIRDNRTLVQALDRPPATAPGIAHLYLGAPNSIKGPTEAALQSQSGNNILLVGQREEALLAILTANLLSIASQFPDGSARTIVFDITPPELPERAYLEELEQTLGSRVELARQSDLGRILGELVAEMKRRAEDTEALAAAPVFLFIHGMQRFNKLRYEEDFGFSSDEGAEAKPSALLNTLLTEGTRLGFHVVASCDTWNNVNRYLSRKALSEFEMRVLFQMSANDSASLIDNPKASMLGLHRALYFNAQEGYLETFRPYALPDPEWIRQLRGKF